MNLPALTGEGSLGRYLEEINRFPMLEAEEEYNLAKQYHEEGDVSAAHRLVTSHLRLVAKIAFKFKGYGLPISDLIAEGNIGLMQSVKKFDPEKGFRLSTYAMWWIKASIQEYILKSWSLVKVGTSSAQKKLFFNLKRMKGQLQAFSDNALTPENVEIVARDLNVSEDDVRDMDARFTGSDQRLNALVGSEGQTEWIDLLPSDEDDQETRLVERDERDYRQALLFDILETLNEREQDIITKRRLNEPPVTLEELSQEYAISRERVRQIEVRAMEKLQQAAIAHEQQRLLPAPVSQ